MLPRKRRQRAGALKCKDVASKVRVVEVEGVRVEEELNSKGHQYSLVGE